MSAPTDTSTHDIWDRASPQPDPTTHGEIKIHWTCPECGREQEENQDAGDILYDYRFLCRKCDKWIKVFL